MKKILILFLVVLLFVAPLGVRDAQALTSAEAEAIAPQLRNMLESLNQVLVQLNARISSQNASLSEHSRTLSNASATLSQISISSITSDSGRQNAVRELANLSLQVRGIGNQVTAIQNERIVVGNILLGITGSLRSILTAFSSAKG